MFCAYVLRGGAGVDLAERDGVRELEIDGVIVRSVGFAAFVDVVLVLVGYVEVLRFLPYFCGEDVAHDGRVEFYRDDVRRVLDASLIALGLVLHCFRNVTLRCCHGRPHRSRCGSASLSWTLQTLRTDACTFHDGTHACTCVTGFGTSVTGLGIAWHTGIVTPRRRRR